jgi:acetylornithine/succinyldiaminopimelate/putrescine aminotransferase
MFSLLCFFGSALTQSIVFPVCGIFCGYVCSKCLKTFYENPVMIVRGEGQYLYDENGRQYLDAYNNVQIGIILSLHSHSFHLHTHTHTHTH